MGKSLGDPHGDELGPLLSLEDGDPDRIQLGPLLGLELGLGYGLELGQQWHWH